MREEKDGSIPAYVYIGEEERMGLRRGGRRFPAFLCVCVGDRRRRRNIITHVGEEEKLRGQGDFLLIGAPNGAP